jgi:soluble lytic murein transglycosylase
MSIYYTSIYSIIVLFLAVFTSKPVLAIESLDNSISYQIAQNQVKQSNVFNNKSINQSTSRKIFKKALKALDNKNKILYKQYFNQLNNYPLTVYLTYKKLRKNLSKSSDKDIKNYIKRFKNTPYADIIRKKWLDKLAKNKQWKRYLVFYSPQKSTRRQCDYLSALIHNKQTKLAYSQVEAIWLNAKSQPKSCDPVFKTWENAGHITAELRWIRIQLAMKKGRLSLATYIARPMSKSDNQLLSEWKVLHRKPQKLLKSSVLSSNHTMQQQIVSHSISRLARKKPQQAANLLSKVLTKTVLEKEKLYQIYRAIGLSVAQKHKPGGWLWLDKIPDYKSDLHIQEWRARAAIREQNNSAIISAIKRLPSGKQQSQRWKFWLALASEDSGDKTTATSIYQQLASKRDYYGFLAADKLNLSYNFNDNPIVLGANKFKEIQQYAGIQRAYEFFTLGMKTDAKREWYFVTRKIFNQKQRVLSAKLAQSWGWHDRAIITIANTDKRDDINLRFPLMLEKAVEKYSRLNKLDSAYTYAVIRRESAFAIDARSPVGAMGLMQIMPATGKYVAKKLKLPYKNKQQLYSSDFNLKLGTNYLQDMLKKFYQQPVLASAAYNAGGHRVKAWLPKKEKIKAVDWVESIPFKETREYVSAILAYTAIYQHRLGKPITRLTHRMPDVPIKK